MMKRRRGDTEKRSTLHHRVTASPCLRINVRTTKEANMKKIEAIIKAL